MTSPRDFWEDRHRKADLYWLTGTSFADLFEAYDLPTAGPASPGVRVTEIGVGTGRATREMYDAGYDVTAVDIADAALLRVADYARILRVDRLAEAAPADIAFAHLLFQHIPETAEVARILRATPLAPGGAFCFQTAWMEHAAQGLAGDLGGLFWRPPGEMRELAVAAGLSIVWEKWQPCNCKGDEVWWGLFRVTR